MFQMWAKVNKIICDLAFPIVVYVCELSAAGLHYKSKLVLRNRGYDYKSSMYKFGSQISISVNLLTNNNLEKIPKRWEIFPCTVWF